MTITDSRSSSPSGGAELVLAAGNDPVQAARIRGEVALVEAENAHRLELANRQHQGKLDAGKSETWGRRRARLRAGAHTALEWARERSAALFAMVVYGAAVLAALRGQITGAVNRLGWALSEALTSAIFLEGFALAAALTAHRLRARGERALAARILTWIAALIAAAINLVVHWPHEVQIYDQAGRLIALHTEGSKITAVLNALASIGGISIWELRSNAKHRPALRAQGLMPWPPPKLGLRFWLRFPRTAYAARSACIADPTLRTRDQAIAAGRDRMRARTDTRARARLTADLREAVRQAGDNPTVIESLRQLAVLYGLGAGAAASASGPAIETGAPRPALPSGSAPSRAQAERELAVRICRWIRAQLVAGRALSDRGFTEEIVAAFAADQVSKRTAEQRKSDVRNNVDLTWRENGGTA